MIGFKEVGQATAEDPYRHGVRRVILKLPAGYLEATEEPIAAGRSELWEETAYGYDTCRESEAFAVCGTQSCGRVHLFLARGVERVADLTNDDLGEMEVLLMAPDQFLSAVYKEEAAEMAIVSASMRAYPPCRNPSVAGRREHA